MKAALKSAVASALYRTGALALYQQWQLRDRAVILMYHRVFAAGDVPPEFESGMYVTADAFERQLAHLAEAYEIVTLDALLEWLDGRRHFAKPPCALTFDDGWRDNYLHAYPLLRKYGAPATVFLVTSQIGSPDMLSWSEVREMSEGGVTFASHTVTHRELTILTASAMRDELTQSRQDLERQLPGASSWFCYPKGYYNSTTLAIAREHYVAAVTTRRRPVTRGDDRFQLPRIGVHQDVSSTTPLFALRLAGL